MKLSAYNLLLGVFLLFLWSCTSSDEVTLPKEEIFATLDEALEAKLKQAAQGKGLSFFTMPSETDYVNIPQDPNNKITKEKVTLGQLLFHETAIGINPRKPAQAGTYSCASCHHAAAGFQAGIRQGVGEGGVGFGKQGEARKVIADYGFDFLDIQPIRTPTVLNTAWQEVMLWNGQLGNTPINTGTEAKWALRSPKALNFLGFQGLEIQAMAGLIIHRQRVNTKLIEQYPEYKTLFDQAFSDIPVARRYTDTIAGLAIAAYERTLLTNQAPFQKWLQGDKTALTEEEKKGAILFFDKAACVNCHTGPALSANQFHALGMKDLIGEGVTNTVGQDFFTSAEGRGGFTGKSEDLYQFKVPTLYNLSDVSFYGHGGSFNTVQSVVEYKNRALPENEIVPKPQLSKQFKPLNLTNEEIKQITAFLERGLRDPNLFRYVPNRLPSGKCFPNNDDQSKADLGCQ
jgi:cytochrome c peroxidase